MSKRPSYNERQDAAIAAGAAAADAWAAWLADPTPETAAARDRAEEAAHAATRAIHADPAPDELTDRAAAAIADLMMADATARGRGPEAGDLS